MDLLRYFSTNEDIVMNNPALKYRYKELARLELQLYNMKQRNLSIADPERIRVEDQIEEVRRRIRCLEDEDKRLAQKCIKNKEEFFAVGTATGLE